MGCDDLIVWVERAPGRLVGVGVRRGSYDARKVESPDGSPWGRWTLSGPRKGPPWTAGTLAEVQEAATFIDGRREAQPKLADAG